MSQVYVMNHPLITHKITMLRDINTNTKDFRALVYEIAMLMGYEATKVPMSAKGGPCGTSAKWSNTWVTYIPKLPGNSVRSLQSISVLPIRS